MIRRLLIGLLVLLVVLTVAVDRVGEKVAAHVLAGKLQTDEHLPAKPGAAIGGIPFLTQAFGGDYKDVSVVTTSFTTPDGVPIDGLTAHLHGVHIPLSDVLHGSVSKVPVDHVDGTVSLSFASITKYLAGHNIEVKLRAATGDRVAVVQKVLFGKHKEVVHGLASVSVSDGAVTLQIGKLGVEVRGQLRPVPLLPTQSIPKLTIPLGGLPFRINVTSVSVNTDGISGTGTADGVTLGD